MVPADRIIATLHSHWAAVLAPGVVTLFPGSRIDTAGLLEWFEFCVDAWSDPPRRTMSPDRLSLVITLHGFSRHPTQKTGVHRLASLARNALSGRTLPIAPSETISKDFCACLRIREHTAHDLTRNHAALGQERLQHLVLNFEAIVEETPTPSA